MEPCAGADHHPIQYPTQHAGLGRTGHATGGTVRHPGLADAHHTAGHAGLASAQHPTGDAGLADAQHSSVGRLVSHYPARRHPGLADASRARHPVDPAGRTARHPGLADARRPSLGRLVAHHPARHHPGLADASRPGDAARCAVHHPGLADARCPGDDARDAILADAHYPGKPSLADARCPSDAARCSRLADAGYPDVGRLVAHHPTRHSIGNPGVADASRPGHTASVVGLDTASRCPADQYSLADARHLTDVGRLVTHHPTRHAVYNPARNPSVAGRPRAGDPGASPLPADNSGIMGPGSIR